MSSLKRKKNSFKPRKKGSILDFFFILIVLFLIGLITIIALFLTNIVRDINIFQTNTDAARIMSSTRNTIVSQDNLFLFILIGMSVFTIVSAAMVWNHPAFFIVMIFLLSIAVTMAAIVSNAFEDVTTTAELNSTTASFPKINFIMDNLPLYIALMGMITGIVMYVAYTRT